MLVPLVLMPGWAQGFLFWQPFAGLVDIPYRIYFGNLTGTGAAAGWPRRRSGSSCPSSSAAPGWAA